DVVAEPAGNRVHLRSPLRLCLRTNSRGCGSRCGGEAYSSLAANQFREQAAGDELAMVNARQSSGTFMAGPLGTHTRPPPGSRVHGLPAQQDGARVMTVLAEIGSRAAGIVPLDVVEPGQLVGPFSRGQPAVTLNPAETTVIGGQHESPAITLA